MTPQEREAKWVRWPQGDAGDAVDFACDHAVEPVFFLEDWRSNRADEWPDYMRWLNVQRDGARAASCDTHPKDGDVKQAPLVSGAVPKADAQTPPQPQSESNQ